LAWKSRPTVCQACGEQCVEKLDLSAGKNPGNRQRLHGVVQRPVPGRMFECALVHEPSTMRAENARLGVDYNPYPARPSATTYGN
jgi:hypothetical protein